MELGTVIGCITFTYEREDDQSIDLRVDLKVHPGCDPHEYAPIFIRCLERLANDMRAAHERLITRDIAERN